MLTSVELFLMAVGVCTMMVAVGTFIYLFWQLIIIVLLLLLTISLAIIFKVWPFTLPQEEVGFLPEADE